MESITREFWQLFYMSRRNILHPHYFHPHVHDALEVIYVLSGGGLAFCNGRRYILQPGSIFLAFPNQVHYLAEFVEGEYIIVYMHAVRLRYHSDIFESGLPETALYSGDDNDLASLLDMALKEFEASGYTVLIDGLMTIFFEKLLKGYTISKNRQASNCLASVVQYCDQHYLEDISIATLSRELHFSRSYISRLFNERMLMSFSTYINSLRLDDAVKLLKSRSHSITEISFMSGFSSLRTFNRVFQEQYGMSPSEYRKSLPKGPK